MEPAKTGGIWRGGPVGFAELFLVAVGLSMDAFAVAICKGLGMKRLDVKIGRAHV